MTSRRVCTVPGCGRRDTRPYIVGARCPAHTPAAMAGRPEPPEGGDLGAWIKHTTPTPTFARGATDIDKERPGGYVSRQRAERIAAGTAPRQARGPRPRG